jgi:hypothetical protein
MRKCNTPISAEAIVEIVNEAKLKNRPQADVTAELAKAGLSPEQAAEAYEMFDFAMNRAFMDGVVGLATADYDDDPVFQAALKKVRGRFPPRRGAGTKKVISFVAIGAAILVGVLAIGLVGYHALSAWRSSR